MSAAVMSANTSTNPSSLIRHEDEEEWPSLGGGTGGGSSTAAVAKNQSQKPESSHDDHDDNNEWEFLAPPADEDSTRLTEQEHSSNVSSLNRVVFQEQVEIVAAAAVASNPRLLRHSASSPDLRRFSLLSAVGEDVEELSLGAAATDDSFSMVSGVGSVWSTAAASSWSGGLSFRDVMLAKAKQDSAALSTPQKSGQEGNNKAATSPRRRPKAKFVVVSPIKRCAKSTGDLQSLVIVEGDDEDCVGGGGGGGGGAGPVLGETDAMDFYHRKDKGAKGYSNGLKLRPDEAKRRSIIMHKKDVQRKQQANAC